jgi:signal transduction histidine kinase
MTTSLSSKVFQKKSEKKSSSVPSGISSSKKPLTHATQHLNLINRLTKIFHSSLNPKIILKLTLLDTIQLLNATSGSVVLINPETGCLEIEASAGLSAKGRKLQLRMGEGVTGWVAFHGKPARIGNVKNDSRYVAARKNIRSELAVPIERRHPKSSPREEKQIIGVLNVDSTEHEAFTQADENLLCTVASQISSLIQNAWLYQQAQQRAKQLDALLKLGQSFIGTETLDELLEKIARGSSEVMNSSLCSVMLLDSKGEYLNWSASSTRFLISMNDYAMPVDNSQLGMVVRRKKPVMVPEIQKADPFPFTTMPQLQKLVSLLGVPLLRGDTVLGVLAIFTNRLHLFSNDDIQIASALANQAALAIQKSFLSDKLISTEELVRQSERLSAIGLLAAEVAHEIRNPLTVIKMLTYNLEKDIPENDPRRKDFQVLSRKMDQMNRTVERVLGLARNSEPVFEPIPLNSVVEDLVLLIRHKLSQQSIQLKLSLGQNLAAARVDRAQIEQALLNLVLNAIHAMPQGGMLELKTGRTDGKNIDEARLWIEIKDSGIGMTDQLKETLFQPFLTTRVSGTGLGMAIVSKIIDAHGGEIRIRSQENRGTSVRIFLQIAN